VPARRVRAVWVLLRAPRSIRGRHLRGQEGHARRRARVRGHHRQRPPQRAPSPLRDLRSRRPEAALARPPHRSVPAVAVIRDSTRATRRSFARPPTAPSGVSPNRPRRWSHGWRRRTRSRTSLSAARATAHTRTVEPLRLVPVVRATAELDVVEGRLAARRIWNDVMEFEEPPFPTPPAIRGHETTPPLVASDHPPPDFRRDVPGVVRLPSAPAGAWRRRELLLLEVGDEQHECAVDDLRDVSAGNRMTQEIPSSPQSLACLRAGREADLVTIGPQRP